MSPDYIQNNLKSFYDIQCHLYLYEVLHNLEMTLLIIPMLIRPKLLLHRALVLPYKYLFCVRAIVCAIEGLFYIRYRKSIPESILNS